MMKKIITTILLIIWITLILVLSFQNGHDTANTSFAFTQAVLRIFMRSEPDYGTLMLWDGRFRLYAHFGLFFSYAMIAVAFPKSYGAKLKISALTGLLTGVFFAVISEVGKLFIDGRHCDLGEMGWNLVGALAGALVIFFFLKMIEKIKQIEPDDG